MQINAAARLRASAVPAELKRLALKHKINPSGSGAWEAKDEEQDECIESFLAELTKLGYKRRKASGGDEYTFDFVGPQGQTATVSYRYGKGYMAILEMRGPASGQASVTAGTDSVYGSIVVVRTKQTISWDGVPESEVRRQLLRSQEHLGDFQFGKDWKWSAPDPDDQVIVTEKQNKTFVGKTALRDLAAYLGLVTA